MKKLILVKRETFERLLKAAEAWETINMGGDVLDGSLKHLTPVIEDARGTLFESDNPEYV